MYCRTTVCDYSMVATRCGTRFLWFLLLMPSFTTSISYIEFFVYLAILTSPSISIYLGFAYVNADYVLRSLQWETLQCEH